ncbi:MAG: hypothetical protein KHZ87_05705 [Clostridiales bacterium]|nr:hypothetical protein [Clostridiales bacterium]MBS5877256.1 hypothetical protein [Clostridiales bacterium]
MSYRDMWLELRARIKSLRDKASDSFQLMLVDSVVEIMDEIEEKAE